MYVTDSFVVGIDYAKKRCFRVSDRNVFQNVAVDVNRLNTSSQIRRKFRQPGMTLLKTQVVVVTQQTSQVRTELDLYATRCTAEIRPLTFPLSDSYENSTRSGSCLCSGICSRCARCKSTNNSRSRLYCPGVGFILRINIFAKYICRSSRDPRSRCVRAKGRISCSV